jgi:predicted esterase
MSEPYWVESHAAETGYMLREGVSKEEPLIVMLHGWSGDEKVMWIFESVLPEGWWIAAPRGLFPLEGGGYNWLPGKASNRHAILDFKDAVLAVDRLVGEVTVANALSDSKLVLMGFSQGAALAFSVAEASGTLPTALVSLAGFLPDGNLQRMARMPIFWGHGLHDGRVPVELAREAVLRLRGAEAEIHYCEADVGHKVGIECARGLKGWLRSIV